MRILFLACLRAHTGNSTTAERIKNHLQAAGHECELRDAAGLHSSLEVGRLIVQKKFDAGLVIHLYKAGRFFLGNKIPFGAVFGGTDINEDVKNEEKYKVMEAVLEDARFAVAFTYKIKDMASKLWPQAKYKIHIQSQGILTMPNVSFMCDTFLQNAGIHHNLENLHIFLLVCGLRKVKDPLFLVEAFAEWHKRDPSVYLAIIGPMVDQQFTNEVKAKLHNIDGVRLIGEIAQADLQTLVKKCFAVVNSSLSEGMSAALLEAMDLEIPVFARDIPGNAEIIKHEDTGFLFSTPQRILPKQALATKAVHFMWQEFVQLAKRLMSDPPLKKKIIHNAKQYVCTYHSWELERETYQYLVQTLTN